MQKVIHLNEWLDFCPSVHLLDIEEQVAYYQKCLDILRYNKGTELANIVEICSPKTCRGSFLDSIGQQ